MLWKNFHLVVGICINISEKPFLNKHVTSKEKDLKFFLYIEVAKIAFNTDVFILYSV